MERSRAVKKKRDHCSTRHFSWLSLGAAGDSCTPVSAEATSSISEHQRERAAERGRNGRGGGEMLHGWPGSSAVLELLFVVPTGGMFLLSSLLSQDSRTTLKNN